MGNRVLVVESPAKANTIKKYLGKDYQVVASYGHLRDLLAKQGGVDPEHNFHMIYVSSERSKTHINTIANALKGAKELLLATDPDREGEAIAWHVLELMKERGLLNEITVQRVVFHEITKTAVLEAVKHPRELSMDLVNAQLARRALDFLVGFNLSPLLWKKIRYGLSAGRVQSPALRLIVTREDEVANFKAQEYWDLTAVNAVDEERFSAKLVKYQGQKLEQFSITNKEQAESYRRQIEQDAGGHLTVSQLTRKERKRKPAAPFTTSTLQQEAARKLGMAAKRTMNAAQKLYEAGYITYMRTDSVSLAVEAIDEIRTLIGKIYGEDSLPAKPQRYQNKSKNAQEAHEAIRPTHIQNLPDELALPLEQQKLYRLIWQRTVASQMAPAVFDTVTADLQAADHLFVAHGSVLVKKGFLGVYQEGTDEGEQQDDKEDRPLPALRVGEQVTLLALTSKQHFTEPPPFYNEATLVKTLEAYGIGRPSTYATIIDTLLGREYVVLERKQFHPTDIGRVVNDFLVKYFTVYVDYDFTAHLEDKLDAVAKGEVEYLLLLEEFWQPFKAQIGEVDHAVSKQEVIQQELGELCPECGRPLQLKLGRKGKFISCSGFPACSYAKPLAADEKTAGDKESKETSIRAVEVYENHLCPECQGVLHIVSGKYGKFVGCSNYPECKHIEPLIKPKSSGVRCPQCGKGELVERKSRRGKLFYSCECYPTCKYALWDRPIAESCPKCQNPILVIKKNKKDGERKICPREGCGWYQQL